MATADFLEFRDISSESKGTICPGRLKLTDQNVIFKNSKTGKVDTLSISEIEISNWLRLVDDYGLRLFFKNGSLQRFIGFKDSEKQKVAKYFRDTYQIDIIDKELCVSGYNWGTTKFLGSVLSFDVNDVTAFEIPLNTVSQCRTGKNEVSLEFHQNDAPVSLIEMRFHVPLTESAGAVDTVEAFHSQVMKQASVISVSGDAIAIFREIQILTPRGRYDIKIFPTFFQLHGKTFDYKVPMSTVIRLFILPHKDGRRHFLVISVDPPIKQGQTRYHYIVLLFNYDDEDTSLELPFTEEEIKTKYEGKITKELSGPTYEVLGKIMKVLVNRKITMPSAFKSHTGTSAISCSYKAAAGHIYPLDRGFIYMHKPTIHIRFEEISSVNFARGGGNTRFFDFEIVAKNGLVHAFSSIEREEYEKLYDFITENKINIKNRAKPNSKHTAEDFGDSDVEDEPDAYLAHVKREGENNYDDDDDESTDEDFEPPNENNSEVDDEYDSNIADSDSGSGSDTASKEKKSKLKRAKKEPRKESSKSESESGCGSDTADEEKSKPKRRKSSTVRSEKRTKKARKPKDENKPKKPLTAFMIWLNETREQIKANNPGIKVTDVARKGGEMWKKMSSTEKQVYDKKTSALKEKYLEAMKEYEKSGKANVNQNESKYETNENQNESKSKSNTKSPGASSTAGAGSHFASKEFIESDDTSSDSDADKSNKKSDSKLSPSSSEKMNDSDEDESTKNVNKRKKEDTSSDEDKNYTSKRKKDESESSEEKDDSLAENSLLSDEDKRKKEDTSSDEDKNYTSKKKKDESESSEEKDDSLAENSFMSDKAED